MITNALTRFLSCLTKLKVRRMVARVSSEGPESRAAAGSLIVRISTGTYSASRESDFFRKRPGEIDWNNTAPSFAEDLNLVKNRIRSNGCRRSHQYQLTGTPKRPSADLLPVVARGIIGAIQKDREAIGLKPGSEGGCIGCTIAPRIGYEKVIAEDEVQQTTHERAFSVVAGVLRGMLCFCSRINEMLHLKLFSCRPAQLSALEDSR